MDILFIIIKIVVRASTAQLSEHAQNIAMITLLEFR